MGEDHSSEPGRRVLLLFDTTHAAMEAEEHIITGGFWCDVVPRPPRVSDSLCGLAIEVDADDLAGVESLLSDETIPYETYEGDERLEP